MQIEILTQPHLGGTVLEIAGALVNDQVFLKNGTFRLLGLIDGKPNGEVQPWAGDGPVLKVVFDVPEQYEEEVLEAYQDHSFEPKIVS